MNASAQNRPLAPPSLQLKEAASSKGLRCPYCHDAVEVGEGAQSCDFCGAIQHQDCYQEHGRCTSCGQGAEEKSPPDRQQAGPRRRLGQAIRSEHRDHFVSAEWGLRIRKYRGGKALALRVTGLVAIFVIYMITIFLTNRDLEPLAITQLLVAGLAIPMIALLLFSRSKSGALHLDATGLQIYRINFFLVQMLQRSLAWEDFGPVAVEPGPKGTGYRVLSGPGEDAPLLFKAGSQREADALSALIEGARSRFANPIDPALIRVRARSEGAELRSSNPAEEA